MFSLFGLRIGGAVAGAFTRRIAATLALLWVGLGALTASQAAEIISPAGLQPGERFRIVFVTPGSTLATSTDIADYNAFVTGQASGYTYLGAAVGWRVIGSTASVSAIANIPGPTDSPVYLNDGATKIASSLTAAANGLWSGSILANLNKDLAGNVIGVGNEAIWTGTAVNGTASLGHELGSGGSVQYGFDNFTSGSWIADFFSSGSLNSNPVYGISDELVVPGSTTVINAPVALKPGERFRIAFVTPGGTLATSTDIADYNAFVTGQASGYTYLGAAVGWRVIGSTASVSAIANIPGPTDSPVYLNDGATKIASSLTAAANGLWSGSILANLNKDLAGNVIGVGNEAIWTGTAVNGTASLGHELGSGGSVQYGLDNFTSGSWIADFFSSGSLNSNPVYGISDELVVPGSTTVINAPVALKPGERFRIAFVTPGGTLATSTDIADYNAFVTGQASGYTYLGAAVGWRVIGSTASVSAIANIPGPTDSPVYLNDGATKIASSLTAAANGLWSGSILANLNKDLASNVIGVGNKAIWTGTAVNGTASLGHELGSGGSVQYGLDNFTSGSWIADFFSSGSLNSNPVYGISDELVVGTLDIDASNTATKYDALTDGLLALRYLFGFTGATLTNGALGTTAMRTTPTAIHLYLDGIQRSLDVDGNGTTDPLADGLLILRYLFGFRGSTLIAGAVADSATRTTAPQIEAYIQTLMP